MPMFEFECSCGLRFEKLIRGGPPEAHTCKSCGAEAPRVLSDFGFSFGDGKVDGNTGVHSLDTNIDHRIGRDAKRAWEVYKDRFSRKRQVQREAGGEGNVPVKIEDGDYVPMTPEEVDRFKSMHAFNRETLAEHRKERKSKGIGQHDEVEES